MAEDKDVQTTETDYLFQKQGAKLVSLFRLGITLVEYAKIKMRCIGKPYIKKNSQGWGNQMMTLLLS